MAERMQESMEGMTKGYIDDLPRISAHCIDTVRRNFVLVTHASEGLIAGYKENPYLLPL